MRFITGLLLITMLGLLGCADQELDIKRIPLTTISTEAEVLMRQLILNEEEFRQDENEDLLSEILSLDPHFTFAKMYAPRYQLSDPSAARETFISGYENRAGVSPIEKRIIEAMHAGFIAENNLDRTRILEEAIIDYPDYYKLRLLAARSNTALGDPISVEQRLLEAKELNPNSFETHIRLATLHFPVGDGFVMLSVDDRDLDKAKMYLQQAQKILPNSPTPSRFLGNIYRDTGDLDDALDAYMTSSKLIDDQESQPFAGTQLMIGHTLMFQGKYDEARNSYKIGFDVSPDLQWKFLMGMYGAQSYLFERKYGEAVVSITENKNLSQEFADSDEQKLRFAMWAEEAKFRALSHSLNEEGAQKAVDTVKQLSKQISKLEIDRADSPQEVARIKRNSEQKIASLNIWKDILFARFDSARTHLDQLQKITLSDLSTDPNAMVPYYKFQAHLHLMEGDPKQSIEIYSKFPRSYLDDDVYHLYFYALAKKAIGDLDESRTIFEYISGYYFYDWGSALVRNLVEDQLASW